MLRPSFNLPITLSLVVGMFLLTNCRLYKPVTAKAITPTEKAHIIHQQQQASKYFILRQSSGYYAMSDIKVDTIANTLYFKAGPLPPVHTHHANNKMDYKQFELPKGITATAILQEVHVYANGTIKADTSAAASIPLDSIKKIDVIVFDKATTQTTYIVGYALVAAFVAGIVDAIINFDIGPMPPWPRYAR